ncbi:hypothetical protein [Fusibacter ferrireducens]|uniref:DUF1048 domain-containing protein n=1 Tax=Fusibacter ferrireducens TaxID=2785058 RepID=A0ABR9ZZV6_9FIRM|nr:hypothetical protein [Fusibacter ferrireducens]MBF4695980.1 hypothetical protein [Fusibacter ferrireducens]
MNKRTKKLNQINNALDKKLNKSNDIVLTDIMCYLRVANISEYHQEVVRHDLLEMVLSAQERNEDIQTVIGEDYKIFCDDVITSLPSKTLQENIFELFDIFFHSTSILGAITLAMASETYALIKNTITNSPKNFQLSISIFQVGAYFATIIGAYILVQVVFGNALEHKAEAKHTTLKTFVKGASFMALLLFLAWIGKKTLFTINIVVLLLIVISSYLIHKLLSNAY